MEDRGSQIYAARQKIKSLISDYPELIGMIPDLINQSIIEAMSKERDLRAKTEVALVWALARRSKAADEDLARALGNIQESSCFNFASTIERLKS